MKKEPAEIRFWRHVKKQPGCWPWTGYLGRRSRKGVIWVHRKPMYASRFSYLLHYGHLPDDKYVCHTCDNPTCVKPGHLFLGTQDDNMKDMVSKGRSNRPIGVRNGRAVLTEDDVRFIRANYRRRHPKFSQKALAERFGLLSVFPIQCVLNGSKWAHVKDEV